MPTQITNHTSILEAIRSVTLIDELVENHNGHFTYELDLEVIAYGRNYTGKKVGPYINLFVYGPVKKSFARANGAAIPFTSSSRASSMFALLTVKARA